MSWRDDPEIIWQDDDDDRIERTSGFLSAVETDRRVGYASGIDVAAPESVADRVEATERWLAALGLTADNIRERPRPLAEGDRVAIDAGLDVFRVVHVDGDAVLLRRVKDDRPWIAWRDHLVHVTHPEADEAEPEWVITRDPQEIAAAVEAERVVEYRMGGGWGGPVATAERFRGIPSLLSIDYRYEGPAIEAPVERCTPDNRTCDHDGPLCNEPVDGFSLDGTEEEWLCFRPVGHGGDCIPCDPNVGDGLHNLHLRPEDR